MVLSMDKLNGPFIGNSRMMMRPMKLWFRSTIEKKRWILRKQGEDFAGESKAINIILKHNVFTLHRAATKH